MEADSIIEKILSAGTKGISFIIFLAVVVLGALSSYYTVDPDEEAVVIRFGKYQDTYGPGLHFKLPFAIDRLIRVKTKKVHQAEFGFRTKNVRTRVTTYSNNNFQKESLMLTGDLNVADVEWVVQYQIADPFKFLFQTSSPQENIRDVSESIMRRVVGDRPVTDVLTTGRVEISVNAKKLMQEILDNYDMGVRIIAVKLQDVNPPGPVKASFNEVNEAKQEQEKVINQAEEAYNKVIPEARGKAEKLVSEAEGYSKAIINRTRGDAEKFVALAKEFRNNPDLTRSRLYLEAMEDIFSQARNVIIVDEELKGLLPIFQSPRNVNKVMK